jgi:hypothetical protein
VSSCSAVALRDLSASSAANMATAIARRSGPS